MNPIDRILDNQWVVIVLSLLTACYAGLAAPKLGPGATEIVTASWFRFLVVFIVSYIPKKNFSLALMIAVGFVVISNVMFQYKILENFMNHEDIQNY